MADRNTKRLSPKILQDDLDAYAALEAITDFAPSNAKFAKASGSDIKTAMTAAQSKEIQDNATAKASRDTATIAEWEFHDYIRNARTQAKAQYGESSDELQALGLKKKSEYKKPTKAKAKPPTA